MGAKICYLGDGSLAGAASYLAGIMLHDGLPWDMPPGIGGFNAITAKPDAQTVLCSMTFSVRRTGDSFQFTEKHRCFKAMPSSVKAAGLPA